MKYRMITLTIILKNIQAEFMWLKYYLWDGSTKHWQTSVCNTRHSTAAGSSCIMYSMQQSRSSLSQKLIKPYISCFLLQPVQLYIMCKSVYFHVTSQNLTHVHHTLQTKSTLPARCMEENSDRHIFFCPSSACHRVRYNWFFWASTLFLTQFCVYII
jgi:hypothetical protein